MWGYDAARVHPLRIQGRQEGSEVEEMKKFFYTSTGGHGHLAWRKDFRKMIEKCTCLDKAYKGVCTPKECYPALYKLLYPHGGCPTKSYVARFRLERRKCFIKPKRKGVKVREKAKTTGVREVHENCQVSSVRPQELPLFKKG